MFNINIKKKHTHKYKVNKFARKEYGIVAIE